MIKVRYFTRENSFSSGNTYLSRIFFPLILPALVLVVISLATFYSIDIRLFRQQIFLVIVSLLAYFFFLNIDYRVFRFFSNYIYACMLGLLIILFLIGVEAKGAVRWIDIFGLRLQFSEIIKPFFIIFMASFLTKDENRSFGKFLKALILLFPIFFLTLKQPDLGNAIIYLSVTIFMLLLYGFPLPYFGILATVVILPLPLFYRLLHDYQRARLLSFLNITQDPFGSSYNAIQALISIGSGGFLGTGFGQATQSILKFLPERHTDFIFATISESLGLVGGVFLIALFAWLLYQIYRVMKNVNDSFTHLVLVGFYFLLLTHIFFNIGMNLGILPIVGITLPFVSYGGSSLLTNFIILGIVSSINFEFRKRSSIEIS